MQEPQKPVRKCHSCLLNLGDVCWAYDDPREQWRNQRKCPGFDSEVLHQAYRLWQRDPAVPGAKELRRERYRKHLAPQRRISRAELEAILHPPPKAPVRPAAP
jgi:hypothetical protein